jgi:hypothetical protein
MLWLIIIAAVVGYIYRAEIKAFFLSDKESDD